MKRVAAGLLAGLFVASPAHGEPLRILVAAGHRYGAPSERPLQYARDDAMRVSEVFRQIGGVRPDAAIFLDEPTGAQLAAALERARVMAQARRPDEVSLVFYFSGHGDRERLHLAAETMAVSDLAARVAKVPAALRVVVLDACRNDDTREKGMSQDAPFAVALPDGTGAAVGTVWIHASSEGDPAQESRELGGGVFTHYWLSGLRGAADADSDRRVTLAEAYDYAYHQTLFRSARASGVLQRPTAQLDLRETGPVVLTTPTPMTARLVLPQVADAQYLVYEPRSRRVLSEAWSAADRRVSLALAPGAYVVQRRAAGRGGAAEVTLGRGEERTLGPSDFRDVALETLAQKGGAVIVSPNELEALYAPAVQLELGLVQRGFLRYHRRFDGWAMGVGVHGAVGRMDTAARRVDEKTAGASLNIEWRGAIGPITLRAGGGPVLEWIGQRLERIDAERASAAGLVTSESKSAVGAGLGALLRASWRVAGPLFMSVGADGASLLVPTTSGTEPRFTIGAAVGAGVAF
ncbi:MAG: caspase family protein [Myxococcales bacterium]|nr:caspase family protein [Myxococcales bacterium]